MIPALPFPTIEDYERHLDHLIDRQRFQAFNPTIARYMNDQFLNNPLPSTVIYNPMPLMMDAQTFVDQSIGNIQNMYFPFGDTPQFSNFQAQQIEHRNTALQNIDLAHFQQMLPSISSFSMQGENQTLPQNTPSNGLITLAELSVKYEMTNLISPEARLLNALGIPRYERLFVPPIIQINSDDSLPVINAKIDIICARVEQNKAFLKNTFSALAPSIANETLQQPHSLLTYSSAPAPISLDGYTPEEKREYVLQKAAYIEKAEQELKAIEEKYAILTQDALNAEELSNIPLTGDPKIQTGNFRQAIEDHRHLTIYMKNNSLYPEGAPERLESEYLEKNFKGPSKGVGSNLAYYGGCLLARAAGDGLIKDFGKDNLSGELTAEQQIKQALAPLGYQPSTALPEFSGVKETLTSLIGKDLPILSSNLEEIYQFRSNSIANLNWKKFGLHSSNLFENFNKGNDDGWVNAVFLAKTLNASTPQSAANSYYKNNFKGPSGGAVAEVGYQLGQILAAANLVTSFIPAKAAYNSIRTAAAALGTRGLVKSSLIKLPGGKELLANFAKRNESFIQQIKTLSPASQKELVKSAWKFLEEGVSKFIINLPLGLVPAAAGTTNALLKTSNFSSAAQAGLKISEISAGQGEVFSQAYLNGVPAGKILKHAGNYLEAAGCTGNVGSNMKLLEQSLANEVYCVRYVKDIANVQQILINNFPIQTHHILSDKCIVNGATDFYKKFLNEMKIAFDDPLNLWNMPHNGSHPKPYHNWIRDEIRQIRKIAGKDYLLKRKFFEERIKRPIMENPRMLDAEWWKLQGL